MLNGEKYWIGNGLIGDALVWARNEDDGGRIQAFFVNRTSNGFSSTKIERKLALRSVENAHLKLVNVFVKDRDRLANCRDFESDTAAVLCTARLMTAWKACGIATGAYEAALKYTLSRKQFGKPVAQF